MSLKTQIFKLNNLKKLLTEENSCVSLVSTNRLLALPPFFLNDMKSGILYMLNNKLKKYDRSLGGIVIGYQNIKVLMDENTGIIPIGTSETEVNISVEFYIFQPRIGSYLEGVINKKSNNHIGCLVHRYFNATILKPDNVDYDEWICKDFNVDDKIIFKVLDLDFTGLLPYIEGIVDNENLLYKIKSNLSKSCDIDSLNKGDVNMKCQNDISLSEEFLKNSKEKSKNEQVSELEENVNKNIEKIDFFKNLEKKKRKRDKKKLLISSVDHLKLNKGKSSSDEELTSSTVDLKSNESPGNERKKKKKKNQDYTDQGIEKDSTPFEYVTQKKTSSELNYTIFEESLKKKNHSLSSCPELHKRKKEKKKKKGGEEKLINFNQKTSQDSSSKEVENSVLYSTLLDHVPTKKMRISFCSPIPQSTPAAEKKGVKSSTEDLLSSLQLKYCNMADKKEKKKKQKKRKREDEKESLILQSCKKMKTSHVSSLRNEEVRKDNEKSELQSITEELYRQQLQRVKELLNMSDKDSCVEEKEKKKKFKKQDKELANINKNEKPEINGESDVEEKSEKQSLLDKLCKQELERVKEQLSMTGRESSVRKKTKVKLDKSGKNICKEKKEESSKRIQKTNTEINGTNEKEKKSAMQDTGDELLKQEINRVNEDFRSSYSSTVKEKNEIKKKTNEQDSLREGTHDSLYEKLLKDAKSAIDLGRNKLPDLLPEIEIGKNKNKKDSYLTDVSTCLSKKKSSESKKKSEICLQTHDKYRNGSMYDLVTTPEKVHPDKSLFSDSEQSPLKRVKETNGIEAKQGKSIVQNMLDEFFKEEKRRLQNESDRENLKKRGKKSESGNKSKSDQICHDSSEKEESLYEKLLKEAKSLIDSEDQSMPVKKKKKSR